MAVFDRPIWVMFHALCRDAAESGNVLFGVSEINVRGVLEIGDWPKAARPPALQNQDLATLLVGGGQFIVKGKRSEIRDRIDKAWHHHEQSERGW